MAYAHRQLSSMSESLGQRVEQVLQVQQKANRVLTHVLGAQYTPCKKFTLYSVTCMLQSAVLRHAINCSHNMQSNDSVLLWLTMLRCRRDGFILSTSYIFVWRYI